MQPCAPAVLGLKSSYPLQTLKECFPMPKHKQPDIRKNELIRAALALAKTHGYASVTREQIAERCKVSSALVSYHMGTMPAMRRALIRHAIAERALRVIGQALAANDPETRRVPPELKKEALASLAG